MARRPIASIAADLKEVIAFFKDRHIITSNPSAALTENMRRIHRATYSLILWRFRLKGLREHGKVFVEEIASDALQVLPQILMGYGKTAKLLTRGIIENTLRHIYFSDHPIEFQRMNREGKWYLTMEELLSYAKAHPVFTESEKRFDAINRLSTLYGILSAGVHGRTVRDLEMRLALKRIAYSENAAKEQADLIEKCAAPANFLLAVFHRERMGTFTPEDRRIILLSMPARARQVWREVP